MGISGAGGETAYIDDGDLRMPGTLTHDEYNQYPDFKSVIAVRRSMDTVPTAGARDNCIDVRMHSSQSGTVSQGRVGVAVQVADAAAVVNKTVSGATNASPIVITTTTAHGFTTGDKISVYSVGGNTAANGVWTIISVSSTTFSLTGSTGNGAYTSGGTATNRGLMYAYAATVVPTVARGSLTGTAANGDDLNCYIGYNGGTVKATDAYYLGRNSTISGSEWTTMFTSDANGDYGIRLNGTIATVAIDTSAATITSSVAVKVAVGHRVQFGASGPVILAGSGSPENNVTAPVGSMYLRSDGGAATSMYIKESGSSTTGWVGK